MGFGGEEEIYAILYWKVLVENEYFRRKEIVAYYSYTHANNRRHSSWESLTHQNLQIRVSEVFLCVPWSRLRLIVAESVIGLHGTDAALIIRLAVRQ